MNCSSVFRNFKAMLNEPQRFRLVFIFLECIRIAPIAPRNQLRSIQPWPHQTKDNRATTGVWIQLSYLYLFQFPGGLWGRPHTLPYRVRTSPSIWWRCDGWEDFLEWTVWTAAFHQFFYQKLRRGDQGQLCLGGATMQGKTAPEKEYWNL